MAIETEIKETARNPTGRKLVEAPNKKKAWSREDEIQLQDMWGSRSIPVIAKKLGRSENAIIVRARRMQLGAHLDCDVNVSVNQFMMALGYSTGAYTFNRLVKAGLPVHRHRVHNHSFRTINIDEFWKWAEQNKSLLDFRKFEPLAMGPEPEWAKLKRKYDIEAARATNINPNNPWRPNDDAKLKWMLQKQRYTYQDLSRELKHTSGAIKRRIEDLGLKERPIRNPNKMWTEEEVEKLLTMIEKGCTWMHIAMELDRSELAVRGKYERLQNPEYMKRYWRKNKDNYKYVGIREVTPEDIRKERALFGEGGATA